MVVLEVTVLEPLMLVTTLVMMLTLADEDCEGEAVLDPPEDELVDPPTLFRLVPVALLDDDCDATEDNVVVENVDDGGEDDDDGGVEEEEEEEEEVEGKLEPEPEPEFDPEEPDDPDDPDDPEEPEEPDEPDEPSFPSRNVN